jgi:hypothetical protein
MRSVTHRNRFLPLHDPHCLLRLPNQVDSLAGRYDFELGWQTHKRHQSSVGLLPLHPTVWAPALLTSEGIGHIDMGSG